MKFIVRKKPYSDEVEIKLPDETKYRIKIGVTWLAAVAIGIAGVKHFSEKDKQNESIEE